MKSPILGNCHFRMVLVYLGEGAVDFDYVIDFTICTKTTYYFFGKNGPTCKY